MTKRPTTNNDASSTIQRICAWCGRIETPIGEATSKGPAAVPALPISHTICSTCFVREKAEVERVIKARRARAS